MVTAVVLSPDTGRFTASSAATLVENVAPWFCGELAVTT
jgi:hypothetical protein